jgi:hypothetical protein
MVISTSDVKRLLSTKRGDEGDIELVVQADKDGSTMAVIYLELKEMCAAEGWDLVMGDDLCLIVGPIK